MQKLRRKKGLIAIEEKGYIVKRKALAACDFFSSGKPGPFFGKDGKAPKLDNNGLMAVKD